MADKFEVEYYLGLELNNCKVISTDQVKNFKINVNIIQSSLNSQTAHTVFNMLVQTSLDNTSILLITACLSLTINNPLP